MSLIRDNPALCLRFFNKKIEDLLNDLINGNKSSLEIVKPMKRKSLSININYNDLIYTEITQSPKTQNEDLVSQVGG